MATATAKLENINAFSKYGFRGRPTHQEIIGLIDENEKLTGQLLDRSASFFLNSPEGSFFDGADSMQMLKEEQARLLLRQMSEILLRQHAKTAGRTYHSDRRQLLPNLHHQ